MREFATFDATKFPIVVLKYHDFVPTLEEFVENQLNFEKFAAQNANCVIIADLSAIAFLPSQYRIAQVKWHMKSEPTFLKQKLRIAFLTPSTVSKLVIKAALMMAKPKMPYTVVSKHEKAEAWALKQLSAPYPMF